MYKSVIKPIFDFLFALTGLIVISPIVILGAIGLAIANSGNPFFIQPRPGKNSKVFKLIKFKTMNDKRDASGKLLPDNQRITKVGKFVRSTSLDELPQLINVLKGDMIRLHNEFRLKRNRMINQHFPMLYRFKKGGSALEAPFYCTFYFFEVFFGPSEVFGVER